MKITLDWLKEHLEHNLDINEIITLLAQLGLPHKKIWPAHESWQDIEIVRIKERAKHPNADRLNLYIIELQNTETKQIVCGDQTLEIGSFVPYARDGLIAPSTGLKLKIANIRGIESPGMLCSSHDLNLPVSEKAGVLLCPEGAFGKTISQAFESKGIIEIEVTQNKGEALSIRGIARLLSQHANNSTLLPLITSQQNFTNNNNLGKIESPDCLGIALAKVKYSAQKTDAKVYTRLQLTGHNPTGVDTIDLTNYVAHELGQPMHVFDANKIKGSINITNLSKEESYTPLKGNKIILEEGTLVIMDEEKIISWPGIIGAENSKASKNTTEILLETGVFKIDSMQRRKHNIQTSAAKKFEYGIDPANLEIAINRYCYFLGINCQRAESHPFSQIKTINFDLKEIKKILGINVTIKDLRAKLEPRGFIISETTSSDILAITIPSYKFFDISTPNCIVEEYAMGEYFNIKSINLPPRMPNIKKNELESLINSLNNSARQMGFFEVYNFALTNEKDSKFSNQKGFKIQNSSNENYSTMRASIIPQLLKVAKKHINNQQPHMNFYETGLIYGDYPESEYPTQQLIFTAISPNPTLLLKILYHFTQSNELIPPTSNEHLETWQESGTVFWAEENKKKIAACGKIKNELAKEILDEDYYAMEIFTSNLIHLEKKIYQKPASQASIYKDISFILPIDMPINNLTKLLTENGYDFQIFDIYPGVNLNTQRNYGMRFKFNLEETITKAQLNEKIDQIIILVKQKLNISTN